MRWYCRKLTVTHIHSKKLLNAGKMVEDTFVRLQMQLPKWWTVSLGYTCHRWCSLLSSWWNTTLSPKSCSELTQHFCNSCSTGDVLLSAISPWLVQMRWVSTWKPISLFILCATNKTNQNKANCHFPLVTSGPWEWACSRLQCSPLTFHSDLLLCSTLLPVWEERLTFSLHTL